MIAPRAERKLDRGPAAARIRAAPLDRRADSVALAGSTQPSPTPEQMRAVARRTRAYLRTPAAAEGRQQDARAEQAPDRRDPGTRVRCARRPRLAPGRRPVRARGSSPRSPATSTAPPTSPSPRAGRGAGCSARRRCGDRRRRAHRQPYGDARLHATPCAAHDGRRPQRHVDAGKLHDALRVLPTARDQHPVARREGGRHGRAAGERFSLDETGGERTRAAGYVPAPFIADGKIIDSVGGGVSQFATTLYSAAYLASLQIDSTSAAQLLHRPRSARPRGDVEISRHRHGVDERHDRTGADPRRDRRDLGRGEHLRDRPRTARARADR